MIKECEDFNLVLEIGKKLKCLVVFEFLFCFVIFVYDWFYIVLELIRIDKR